MKLKYYLRGIGVGILFATIILTVANRYTTKNTLTDEEIIKRAKELGMVERTNDLSGLLSTPIPTAVTDASSTLKNTPEGETSSDENTPGEDVKDETVPLDETGEETDPVTEIPTQTPIPTKEGEVTEGKTSSDSEVFSVQKVRIQITNGMTSKGVAKLLKEKGVIEDAESFSQYLKQNDYTKDIRVGEYEIEIHSSYKDITNKIIYK